LREGVDIDLAEKAIESEIEKVCITDISQDELERIHNQTESTHVFGETSIANRALNLCFFEMLGNANDVNSQVEKYRSTDGSMIRKAAESIFKNENCSTLIYTPSK
jgi:arsenate reductase-like glutaredoxin family protein